ncbi:cell division protein ZapE [Sphingomonas sp. ASV193]|uniref:cell division protein ZapE n=1 Tax=Sphingomonas sp. ASV193 TaxID=3144405 RepID=UPI0032E90441
MTGSVADAYAALVAAGEVRDDPDQRRGALALDRFAAALGRTRQGFLSRLFARETPVRSGVYLWGGVGRGKSMLMDLAFANIAVEPKRRTHFAPFMIEVHERLRDLRKGGEGDPIAALAEAYADEVRFLAFDELMVTNPADAMILGRLFTALVEAGVGIVATSNRPPSDLYRDGLNRALFLPFIALVEARFEIVALNGPIDYRLDRLGGMPTWYVPNGAAATEALREAFFRLTDYPVEDSANVPSEELDVGGGRSLHVPKSLKGVAVFSFKRLCGAARGAADYLAIARRFHTVILVGIPVMTREMRNEAARFVTLVDALYEHRAKLLASADAEPAGLYPAGDGSFEFARTVSRLEEMQSADYLGEGHGAARV